MTEEDPEHHRLAMLEIGKIQLRAKPIRYVRQPSSKSYTMIVAVARQRGYKNLNDLIDDLAKYAFWKTFGKKQTDELKEINR